MGAGGIIARALLVLPGCAGLAVQSWEGLSASPAFSGMLLCAFALAAPSYIAAGSHLCLLNQALLEPVYLQAKIPDS